LPAAGGAAAGPRSCCRQRLRRPSRRRRTGRSIRGRRRRAQRESESAREVRTSARPRSTQRAADSMSAASSIASGSDRAGHGGKTCTCCGLRSTTINTRYCNQSPFASCEVIPWGGGTPEKPKGTLCYCCKIVMVKAGWVDEFGSVEARSKPQNTRHYPPSACTARARRYPCSVW